MAHIKTAHVVSIPRGSELTRLLQARDRGEPFERVSGFAGIVGAGRSIASTGCGFGTFADYGKIAPDVPRKKLRSLCEGADIAGTRPAHPERSRRGRLAAMSG